METWKQIIHAIDLFTLALNLVLFLLLLLMIRKSNQHIKGYEELQRKTNRKMFEYVNIMGLLSCRYHGTNAIEVFELEDQTTEVDNDPSFLQYLENFKLTTLHISGVQCWLEFNNQGQMAFLLKRKITDKQTFVLHIKEQSIPAWLCIIVKSAIMEEKMDIPTVVCNNLMADFAEITQRRLPNDTTVSN